MDARFAGGYAMPYEICRHKNLKAPPILVIHRSYQRMNNLLGGLDAISRWFPAISHSLILAFE
jgi:hypothetical protein